MVTCGMLVVVLTAWIVLVVVAGATEACTVLVSRCATPLTTCRVLLVVARTDVLVIAVRAVVALSLLVTTCTVAAVAVV